jgi:hypothetical protein
MLSLTMTFQALGTDNPFLRTVLPGGYGLNDCGVVKYNGEYFITGNWLSGKMFSSRDLVNWGNGTKVITHVGGWAPVHPNDDLWIHDSDPNYVNGVFHLYFQVDDKIGHATASSPMGPYTEPVPGPAFDSGIGADYFRDENGSNYFYTTKFPFGNVIYGQTMSDPWTLTGSAIPLISAIPGTWENPSGTPINEGSWVMKYRGRYYMLYAANDTTSTNYQIGCVEAATPLGFNNTGKYPAPVLARTSVTGGEINTIGSPWVVDGPNGFEKWVGYFAINTRDSALRFQCVDRLHFFDKKLIVDGPTDRFTPGYHPDPAKPTLLNLFNVPDGPLPAADWSPVGLGTWSVLNHEARQTDQATWSLNPVNRPAALNYLIEGNFKFNSAVDSVDRAGVLAYYQDVNNWVVIGVDRVAGNWYGGVCTAGAVSVVAAALPAGWDHSVYHKIRVTRNGTQFDVRLDDMIPAGGLTPINTSFTGAGRPGIYTDNTSASFDGVIYTIGWDEYDSGVRGWGASSGGIAATGNWNYGSNGIFQTNTTGTNYTFKGDLMPQYEFSTQVYRSNNVAVDGKLHSMGILPVMIDWNNYLGAEINLTNNTLFTYGKLGGVVLPQQTAMVPSTNNYNLRAVKLDDRVILFVNGQQTLTVSNAFGPSHVGLANRSVSARYSGILVYRTEPLNLPAPWQHQDIGTVGFPGYADYNDGTAVITASGNDFWGSQDGGHFAFQPITGNAEIIARVDSLDPTSYTAKCGLMFRENLTASSRMIFVSVIAADDGNGTQHQLIWRTTPGQSTGGLVHNNTPILPTQGWLRLTRQGNTFAGYYSTNGSNWNVIGASQVINMAASAYVGLAVTAQHSNRVCGAVFDNLALTQWPTTTSLSSSTNPSTYGGSITLAALVTTTNGVPTGTVTFMDGVTPLGTNALSGGSGNSATASLALTNLTAGSHNLTATYRGTNNYSASTSPPLSQNVNTKALVVTGLTANNRYYDGGTNTTLWGNPGLSGVVGSDTVTLSGTPAASFADSNIGTGKPVTVTGYSLNGSSATNYTLTPPALIADIIPAPSNLYRLSAALSNGNMVLNFLGQPGANYALERTLSLSPPTWVPQATNSASINGTLNFTNTLMNGTNIFWRMRFLP